MAHVLIGWELGSNRGHTMRITRIADVLRRRGHRLSFVLQRVDGLEEADVRDADIWPAPLTPRLLVNTAKLTGASHSMSDILVRLGFDSPTMIGPILKSWTHLLGVIRPDVVIGDFAPFLLTAARGRIPTIACGVGFDTPPSTMPQFPSLTGRRPTFSEALALESVRSAARSAGCRQIERLPEVFGADREMAATFTELDPYAEWRRSPLSHPMLPDLPPGDSASRGEEVFVYAPEQLRVDAPLWDGLVASRLPVRAHISRVSETYRETLRRRGLLVEPEPLPLPLIAQRSRLLVSHGGHGIVCAGLLMGLPHVVVHFDVEKLLNGRAVARLGLGGYAGLSQIEAKPFADSLVQLYRDESLIARARAAAPGFAVRSSRPMEEDVADAVDALL